MHYLILNTSILNKGKKSLCISKIHFLLHIYLLFIEKKRKNNPKNKPPKKQRSFITNNLE